LGENKKCFPKAKRTLDKIKWTVSFDPKEGIAKQIIHGTKVHFEVPRKKK
jgi:hypothetical protein